MFKVPSASLRTFIDTPNCFLEDRVQYSTVHTPNIFCDDYLQIINFVEIIRTHFVYCNRQVHRNFLITLYLELYLYAVSTVGTNCLFFSVEHIFDRSCALHFLKYSFPSRNPLEYCLLNLFKMLLFFISLLCKIHVSFLHSTFYVLLIRKCKIHC
jgi:hypothetical protein